jgi:hypothetical protein
LFKGHAILLDECQELIRRTRMDVIAVLTGVIIDLLGAQLPNKLELSTPFRGYGVGDGDHAAEVRLPDLCDEVLNHECIADCLDVNFHGTSIIARGCAGCDVCVRAALIFGVRKVGQPICDIHLLQGALMM